MNNYQMFRKLLDRISKKIWCVPTVRDNLLPSVDKPGETIVNLLIKIRLLNSAAVTTPMLSLIPFALTGDKGLGLTSFAIGTASIILWLLALKKLRSARKPSELIKSGAVATIVLNVLLGMTLFCGWLLNFHPQAVTYAYLVLQTLIGIPFALASGIDSKLSGGIFRRIGNYNPDRISPNAQFRQCKVAGATAASAIGALIWCGIILFDHRAATNPGWYSALFAINTIPSAFLLFYLRQLNKQLEKQAIPEANPTFTAETTSTEKECHKKERRESVIAIGCLEGLLQFSQLFFSISAIKALFDAVPNNAWLLILIPLMFYIINGIEQFGMRLFSRYHARIGYKKSANKSNQIDGRQKVSLSLLFVAAIFFIAYYMVAASVGWNLSWNDILGVVAYGLFNILKGFANGLSEEWNESMAIKHPRHDEARFTGWSALLGRLCQIAAIVVFLALTGGQADTLETKIFIGTLTVSISALMVANVLAFSWLGQTPVQQESVWRILVRAVVEREKRTALFTQLLRTLFIASLILANILSEKVYAYGEFSFTHGSFFYITLFILINLITVFEDVEAAIKTVFLGMISYVFVFIALQLSSALPGKLVNHPSLTTLQYNDLLESIAWLFFASFFGYTITVILNLLLLTILSKRLKAKSHVVLGAAITLICQIVDTLIFIWFGYGNLSHAETLSLFIGQFSMKFSVYLVMYFPLYLIIQVCRRWNVQPKDGNRTGEMPGNVGETKLEFNS